MLDESTISPEIEEVSSSPDGFKSEPLLPELPASPDLKRGEQVPVRESSSHESGQDKSDHPGFIQTPISQPIIPEKQKAIPTDSSKFAQSYRSNMPKKRKKSVSMLKWLILIAVGLFVISIGSLFWSSSSFSDRDVVLTLEGQDRSTSGDEVTYLLKWQNNTKLLLKDMSFRIFYPEGSVVMVDDKPTQPDSEGFTVDRLMPGESGEREITIFIVGDKGSIKTATVNLIFQAGNLRSAFEKEVQVNTTITNLPVSLTLTAPPTTVSGQPVTYIIDARNGIENDFTDLRLEVEYPEGFSVRDLRPSSDGGSTSTWTIDEFLQGEGLRFVIKGNLTGVQREAKTITAVLKRKVGDEYIDFVRTDSVTLLSSPLLSVSASVNNSREYTAFLGDTLRYKINYRNNSNQNLIGLSLTVRLDGIMYEFGDLDAREGFFDQSVNTVRFSSSGVPDFASLPPGKSGSVEFAVPIKAGFASGGTGSFFVKASTRLSTPNVPTGVEGSEVFSQDVLITKISSQPTLGQTLSVATGSVPLVVGQKTNFNVAWRIVNPGNELQNASVAVTLPPGINWEGIVSGGDATFNPNSQQIVWDIGTIPFGTGAGLPGISANFQVSTTPSSSQKDKIITILSNAVLSGIDSFTGQTVQNVVEEATTLNVNGLGSDVRVQ